MKKPLLTRVLEGLEAGDGGILYWNPRRAATADLSNEPKLDELMELRRIGVVESLRFRESGLAALANDFGGLRQFGGHRVWRVLDLPAFTYLAGLPAELPLLRELRAADVPFLAGDRDRALLDALKTLKRELRLSRDPDVLAKAIEFLKGE